MLSQQRFEYQMGINREIITNHSQNSGHNGAPNSGTTFPIASAMQNHIIVSCIFDIELMSNDTSLYDKYVAITTKQINAANREKARNARRVLNLDEKAAKKRTREINVIASRFDQQLGELRLAKKRIESNSN